jgi:hypothetical protein
VGTPQQGRRATRVTGIGFAVMFVVALTALLGDLYGAFADSAETFPPYFDSTADRLRHALGVYVLSGAGLAFLAFVVLVNAASPNAAASRIADLAAAGFAALLGVAAAAFGTVSLSVAFGEMTGDPGVQRGVELLPQLGYVLVTVPAALSAALAIWLTARAGDRTPGLPRPLVVAGYVVALAQLLSFYTLPLVLLPAWVLGVSVWPARSGA